MIKTIVVPTDGSEHANKAVDLAADLAEKYAARLVILHVLLRHTSPSEIRVLCKEISAPDALVKKLEELDRIMLDAAAASYGTIPVPLPIPDDILKEAGDLICAKARQIAEAKGLKGVAAEIVDGSPADCILAAAEHEKADMIVMGSRGLGNIAGLLMGSVSHKVSHLSKCTCVTVK